MTQLISEFGLRRREAARRAATQQPQRFVGVRVASPTVPSEDREEVKRRRKTGRRRALEEAKRFVAVDRNFVRNFVRSAELRLRDACVARLRKGTPVKTRQAERTERVRIFDVRRASVKFERSPLVALDAEPRLEREPDVVKRDAEPRLRR